MSLAKFKELVASKIYDNNLQDASRVIPSAHKKGSYESKQDDLLPHEVAYRAQMSHSPMRTPVERLRIFMFTGLEVLNDDDLSMLDNNSYLFVSQGKALNSYSKASLLTAESVSGHSTRSACLVK